MVKWRLLLVYANKFIQIWMCLFSTIDSKPKGYMPEALIYLQRTFSF